MSDQSEATRSIGQGETSNYVFHAPLLSGLIGNISNYARKTMYDNCIKLSGVSEQSTILDVGVTNDSRLDSNFFEKMYPYPDKITAVGMEDASFLEQQHPGLKFIKTDGNGLPFADKSFDLVVSFAVVEHVGNRDSQKSFIQELCRVGRSVCITTPNRWYPVEFHTVLPLVHWLPPKSFRAVLKAMGNNFFSLEENLNLLGSSDLFDLLPTNCRVRTGHVRLLGPISNLLFFIDNFQ